LAKSTKIAEVLARFVLAGVFLYAGFMKFLDPAEFAHGIHSFRLTPFWLSAALAIYLPSLEILLALCLLTRKGYRGTIWLLTFLGSLFLFAITSAWVRGIDISCGCFGSSHSSNYSWLLFRDVIFLATAVFLIIRERECMYRATQ
jgi:putative oxidoreductase